jgi:hypothetical protein
MVDVAPPAARAMSATSATDVRYYTLLLITGGRFQEPGLHKEA